MKNQGHYSRGNLDHCIQVMTADCGSVLEVGCMFGRQLGLTQCAVKIGIEVHKPYLDRAETGFEQINEDARTALQKIDSKRVDVVMMIDFIEHLEMSEAIAIVAECQRIAKKRVIIFVPFGDHPQTSDYYQMGADHWQTHRSTWEVNDLVDLGFDVALWRNFHDKPGSHDGAMFAIWEPPDCSVVMSTYNKAGLLDLSLASIRQQDVQFPYEIIVVDDGSTDNTQEICRKHFVRYAYLDRPGYCNPAKARNIGLRMALAPVVIQQCEVIHNTPDLIERLTVRASPRHIDFATVFNADLDPNGTGVPHWKPLCKIHQGIAYSGPPNPRPLFFLGAAMREDLFAVGGHDESFTLPGYEDNWLADCLIHGRGCTQRNWGDVVGFHMDHPRPVDIAQQQDVMRHVYAEKVASGVFCASGGPWSLVPLADEELVSP